MLVKFWTRFARSGDPNGAEAPQATWAALSASQPAYLEVAGPVPEMTYPAEYAQRHDFWRTVFFRPSVVETKLGSVQE
jgi:carboxylesterase type B